MPESLTGAWQQAIDRRAPELEERVFVFLNEQLRRMLSRYVRGQQPMTADENTWLTRILVDYYDRDLARDLLKEPPPGATEEEAKSYKTIYGTVDSLDEVFRIMQSHQDAASQARLVNETTRKILEQFLTGGEDNTPDAVRSFLMSNPNFSNVTKPEFEALVKNISQQVEETYRNRARTIARTELAIAQSKTVAQELRAQGKTHVRIYDGLGCGWRHHDDGDYANGSLRLIEDYLNYPVAHPNCVRAGYPDFFGGDGSIHVGKKDLDLFELKYNPNHDARGRFASRSFGPKNVDDVKTRADLEAYASTAATITSASDYAMNGPDGEQKQAVGFRDGESVYLTHAVRSRDQLETITREGIKPDSAGNVYGSEGFVRDRGAGFVIYRAPLKDVRENVDVVESRLAYPERRTGFVPPSDIVKVVPSIGGVRADEVAAYVLNNKLTPSELADLPASWRSLAQTKEAKNGAIWNVELKYNPNHDRLGRFSSGSGVPGNFVGLEDLDSMLSGIGLEADQEKLGRVLDSVHDLNEFYPKTAGSVVFTFRGPGDRMLTDDHHVSLAHYSRSGLDGKPTIFIDGRLVSKDEGLLKGDLEVRAFTSAHLSKAQEVGFHPKTKDPVTQIVNHEFAHHMAETARQESISGKAEAWTNIRWASYNTQPGRISTYAKTGWDEAWAEGFSYVHELGPKKMKQTAFTKNIWRAIESYDRTIEGR